MHKNHNLSALRHGGLLIAMMLLVTGCNTTKTIYRQSGFDAAALRDGGVGIVAVTRPDTLKYKAAVPISVRVEEQLHARWPELKVVSLLETKQLLGKSPHLQLRNAFHGDGVLPAREFALLRPLEPQVRYVMLVDVRDDRDGRYYYESSSDTTITTTDPETGETTTEVLWTDYTAAWVAYRELRTLFTVYDLRTQQNVWSVLATGKTKWENSRTSISGYLRVALPETPTPADVMPDLTRRVLKQLPKVDRHKPASEQQAALR